MLDRRRLLIILTMIFSAAVTPIAIRITQSHGVPSLVIVLIRLWLVSLALLPWIWLRYRREVSSLTARQVLLSGISGFWLALNLLLLFVSLEYTSVLMTSLLRRTTPLWIVLPEILIFGVVFSRRFWLSLPLTIIGVALVGLGGLTAVEAGSDPLLGGALALIGSLCFGAYLLIGRQLNNVIPPLLYSFLVFFSAALVTSVFVGFSGTPVAGYSARGYLWVIIVTILAQAMGHLLMNLALQHFTATALAIILQIAVVGSAVIALLLFGEVPSLVQVIGSALVIYGVVIATVEQAGARWKRGAQS
ncbi:MAG: DMT family transporter [Chloroflexota bacterium]|nr:DMT family transporter [Chloroflexota bacterium]MDE2907943.1 DMT family transporter [Chloroflexota bacterium]